MICFLDRTFCSHSDECSNIACLRNLTPALNKQARDWWKHDPECPPVAYGDLRDTEYCRLQGGFKDASCNTPGSR